MQYTINGSRNERNQIILNPTTWDDHGYKTSFMVYYIDGDGEKNILGTIKIAKTNQSVKESTFDLLPYRFTGLSKDFYSVWQSAYIYKDIYDLNIKLGINIFEDLQDIAYDLTKYDEHKTEEVLKSSLLREISWHTVKNQCHRIAHGDAVLTPYRFSYRIPQQPIDDFYLTFEVTPDALPPTNVHAIIGSNGVGKTTIIKDIIKSICKADNTIGTFEYSDDDDLDDKLGYFESILCISFSPFDDYSEIASLENCTFIGIKKHDTSNLLSDIQKEFIDSYKLCLNNQNKKNDLMDLLKDIDVLSENNDIFSGFEYSDQKISEIEKEFSKLSSGQKVVLSIATRAIAHLAEKSILFLDEPENHLHPPLLSSLIRSLSRMVIKRNSVAVISTHSPIVLQEIPKSNVWRIGRSNDLIFADRPSIETFGTNVGVLTNEIFSYEVKNTGFNKLLKDVVNSSETFDEVLDKFNNQLGNEAKSIVRMLIAEKDNNNVEN